MRRSYFLLIILLWSSFCAEAQDSRLYFGGGVLAWQYDQVTKLASGQKYRGFSGFYPDLSLRVKVPLGESWGWFPMSLGTPIGDQAGDRAARIWRGAVGIPFFVELWRFSLVAGPGYWMTLTRGNDGIVTLDNGNSTSQFARPNGVSLSRVLYAHLGLGIVLTEKFRLDFEAIALDPLLSQKNWSGAVNFSAGIL